MAEKHLEQAVKIAAQSLITPGLTPFGAVVARGEEVLGTGGSTVMRDCNPVAHAEVNAIVAACGKLGTHLLRGCVLYCSGYPCPLCLSAARWAEVDRVVYAAGLDVSDEYGFRDAEFYRDLVVQDWSPGSVFPVVQSGDVELAGRAAGVIGRWNYLHHEA